MSRSRKKFFWLGKYRLQDPGGRGRAEELLRTGPNSAPRDALASEMDASLELAGSLKSCSEAFADELTNLFGIDDAPLAL